MRAGIITALISTAALGAQAELTPAERAAGRSLDHVLVQFHTGALARALDVGFGFAAMRYPLGLDCAFQQRDFFGGQVEQAVDDAVNLGFGLGDLG